MGMAHKAFFVAYVIVYLLKTLLPLEFECTTVAMQAICIVHHQGQGHVQVEVEVEVVVPFVCQKIRG